MTSKKMKAAIADRANAFRRAAEFRAAAVAYVNGLDKPTSAALVVEGLKDAIAELGIDEKAAMLQLRALATAGLINKENHGKNFYYSGKGIDPAVVAESGTRWKKHATDKLDIVEVKTERISRPRALAHPEQKSEVTIDLVEKDGSLRIGIPGLQISIRKVKE